MTVQGDLVTKTYRGPDAAERQQREELAIRSVADRLPVATIVDTRPGELVLRKIPGRHGQDRIDRGEGEAVMFGLGRLLRDVQAISPVFFGELGDTGVLVHHDFGPNNVLFAEGDDAVVLLADWEWSAVGSPVTDLAWAELIVRLHHPEHLGVPTSAVRRLRRSPAVERAPGGGGATGGRTRGLGPRLQRRTSGIDMGSPIPPHPTVARDHLTAARWGLDLRAARHLCKGFLDAEGVCG